MQQLIFILSLSLLLFSRQACAEDYKHEIAIAMMFQNEGEYLKEWIEYHRMLGVSHFYLFNNCSTDDFHKVLRPYIKRGIVELDTLSSQSTNEQEQAATQRQAYTQALASAKGQVKWLALMDADEFFVPLEKESLRDVLKQYEEYGGVHAKWLLFGTAGIEKLPKNQLLIEAFTMTAGETHILGKSIVRPERVQSYLDAHEVSYKHPYKLISPSDLRINHYYTRDLDHLINIKYPRRLKWIPGLQLDEYIQLTDATLNIQEDLVIQKYVSKLKKKLFLNAKKREEIGV